VAFSGLKGEDTMDFHPFAEKFPLLEGDEWEAFKESIRQTNGPEQPVLYRLVEGKQQGIDGRNRNKACEELGIPCRFEEITLEDDDVKAYIIRRNIRRRHMSKELRQEIILELHEDGKSTRQIAETLGVSNATVSRDLNESNGTHKQTPVTNVTVSTSQGGNLCPRCTRIGVASCPACLAKTSRTADGEVARKKPSANGTPHQPKTLSEEVDEALDQEEDVPEMTVEEVIREQNGILESWCRGLMEYAKTMPEDPWLNDLNRREGAVQKLKNCCETIRSAKCHCRCPKCDGEGCDRCHQSGRVTKYAFDQMS
jgi:transposase-like protein